MSTSSTKFVFCGLISKQKCPPWPIPQKVAHCTQVHDMWPFGPLVVHMYPGKALCLFKNFNLKMQLATVMKHVKVH